MRCTVYLGHSTKHHERKIDSPLSPNAVKEIPTLFCDSFANFGADVVTDENIQQAIGFGQLVVGYVTTDPIDRLAVVASSTGRWGRNFLDRSERRGRAGEGRWREGNRELGAERERERERIERRGRGKEREASGEGEGKGEKREQERVESERERERSESRSEWRVKGKGRAVKPGAPK
ncbi:hypothetical protein MRB53_012232 [Persea americana]|uniref:Uncharacterized protein n=1 Tax=Persea americana TaxID=3435 RepID=A0ACC2LX37_PERAE|nr:hypothetical protein MRB53_012232 [Persea americana]